MRETQSTLHKTLENLEKALAEVRRQPCLWCMVSIHEEYRKFMKWLFTVKT